MAKTNFKLIIVNIMQRFYFSYLELLPGTPVLASYWGNRYKFWNQTLFWLQIAPQSAS